ncbi:hypothetical protein LJR034_004679 [Caballeronia sp. LjRoot34]|uniref:hypothetical protein n=1 Tax=Caballeronia sp. LjRoot34 TaxID=3342325 RepID=UPI003ECE708D
MNCKPGILAFIVVPPDWPRKTLDNKVVEVVYLRPTFAHPAKDQRPTWWCRFPTPWLHNGKPVHECYMLDSWLRPISGVPVDDETPVATNVPEALRLALAIESRWSA